MILQFLHPHFLVEHHTDLLRPDQFSGFQVKLKDTNWYRMIKVVDQAHQDEYQRLYGYLPKMGLVWLGYIPRPPRKEDYTTDDEVCSLALMEILLTIHFIPNPRPKDIERKGVK